VFTCESAKDAKGGKGTRPSEKNLIKGIDCVRQNLKTLQRNKAKKKTKTRRREEKEIGERGLSRKPREMGKGIKRCYFSF